MQSMVTNGTSSSYTGGSMDSGAVYVYSRTGYTWSQQAYIKPANSSESDWFGYSLSLSGDTLAVGAPGEDSNQVTITNGPSSSTNNSLSNSGAVYIFRNKNTLFDPHLSVLGKTATSITLSWNSNLGSGSRVKIAPAVVGTGSPSACTDSSSIALASNVISYTYSGLTPNTKYGFRVCAYDGTSLSQGTTIWDDTLP